VGKRREPAGIVHVQGRSLGGSH